MRARAAIAGIGLLVAFVGVSAAAPLQSRGPQPIFTGFALVKRGTLTTKRCGPYRITRGTYTGRATSPDPRVAGNVTYTGQVARAERGSYGVASGGLVIKDARGRVRMRGGLTGVFNELTVNGLIAGRLFDPNARLLANVTLVFDDQLGFAAVRLGMENGANTGIAYPAVPKC